MMNWASIILMILFIWNFLVSYKKCIEEQNYSDLVATIIALCILGGLIYFSGGWQ